MRDLATLYRNAGRTHDPGEDLGAQYTLDLLGRFALANDEIFRCFDRCRDVGLVPLCTPWDRDERGGARRLRDPRLQGGVGRPDQPRPAAGDGRHGTAGHRVDRDVDRDRDPRSGRGAPAARGRPTRCCTATPRTPLRTRTCNLRYLERLRRDRGLPGRLLGPRAGPARGRRGGRPRGPDIVEKHLTVDRSMEGNDHKVSLLPAELASLVTEIRQVEQALGSGRAPHHLPGRGHEPGEPGQEPGRGPGPRSRATSSADDDVQVRSPGRGLQPNRRHELVGRTRAPTRRRRRASSTPLGPGRRPVPSRGPTPSVDRGACRSATTTSDAPVHPGQTRLRRVPPLLPGPRPRPPVRSSPSRLDVGLRRAQPGPLPRRPHPEPGGHRRRPGGERSIHELQRVVDLTRGLDPPVRDRDRPIVIVEPRAGSRPTPRPARVRARRCTTVSPTGLARLDQRRGGAGGPDPAPLPLVPGRPAPLQPVRRPRRHRRRSPATPGSACASTCRTRSWPCTTRGASFSSSSRRSRPHTRHLHLVDAAAPTARASRSARATSTGPSWPSSSTGWPPAWASSPRSGRATRTTARGSGSPSTAWSSGSDGPTPGCPPGSVSAPRAQTGATAPVAAAPGRRTGACSGSATGSSAPCAGGRASPSWPPASPAAPTGSARPASRSERYRAFELWMRPAGPRRSRHPPARDRPHRHRAAHGREPRLHATPAWTSARLGPRCTATCAACPSPTPPSTSWSASTCSSTSPPTPGRGRAGAGRRRPAGAGGRRGPLGAEARPRPSRCPAPIRPTTSGSTARATTSASTAPMRPTAGATAGTAMRRGQVERRTSAPTTGARHALDGDDDRFWLLAPTASDA